MPCEVSLLKRGAICLALYPFTLGFPIERVLREAEDSLVAQLREVRSIENMEAVIRPKDPPTEVLARFKLRRVLVLHDGRKANIQDVAVARINSVSPEKRSRKNWYARLTAGNHPTAFYITDDASHGTEGIEEYVDCSSVMTIQKSTILQRVGELNDEEMREVSRRLVAALEIELPSA